MPDICGNAFTLSRLANELRPILETATVADIVGALAMVCDENEQDHESFELSGWGKARNELMRVELAMREDRL